MIYINTIRHAAKHKKRYDAILSIYDPDVRRNRRIDTFTKFPGPHWTQHYWDTDIFYDGIPYMPTKEHAREALSFFEEHAHLEKVLVHCHAGIARSTASVLGMLYKKYGNEDKAMADLMEIRPEAMPNLLITEYMDDILGSNLMEAVRELDIRNNHAPLRENKKKLNEKDFKAKYGWMTPEDLYQYAR